MKRFLVMSATALALAAGGAGAALGDAGAPGTTFPEQPGSHVGQACAAVTSNPGTGAGGQGAQNMAPVAGTITGGVLTDACFGG